jgi:hypothetical protein
MKLSSLTVTFVSVLFLTVSASAQVYQASPVNRTYCEEWAKYLPVLNAAVRSKANQIPQIPNAMLKSLSKEVLQQMQDFAATQEIAKASKEDRLEDLAVLHGAQNDSKKNRIAKAQEAKMIQMQSFRNAIFADGYKEKFCKEYLWKTFDQLEDKHSAAITALQKCEKNCVMKNPFATTEGVNVGKSISDIQEKLIQGESVESSGTPPGAKKTSTSSGLTDSVVGP